MTDGAETASTNAATPGTGAAQPVAASADASWTPGPSPQQSAVGIAAEHPELVLGGAFAGGLLLATILKRLGR